MATKIITEHGLKHEIKKVYGYSYPTIRRALRGSDDTEAAKRIRWYALRHGGVEMTTER